MKLKKLTILTLAIILIALLISCNTEDAGIFKQISLSVERDDVGFVDLILKDGDNIYAYTKNDGLSSYNVVKKKWTTIKSSNVTNYTTDDTNIYFSQRAEEGKKNDLYKYDLTNAPTKLNDSAHVVSMAPQHNLVLVKESDKYKVVSFKNDGSFDIKEDDIDKAYTPTLISEENGNYELTEPNAEDGVIAIGKLDGTVVSVNKKGKISVGDKSVSLKGRSVDHLPYPSFVYNDELYLQESDSNFVKIDKDGEVTPAIQSGLKNLAKLSSVRIHSYLVVGSKLYVGTENSGILEANLN